MNKDQWSQKKPEAAANPAERSRSAPSRPAGRHVAAPGSEVIAALKRTAAHERAGDLSWNPWQP